MTQDRHCSNLPPSTETAQGSPLLVAQWDEGEKSRAGQLRLSILIAAAVAVTGYLAHGFLTVDKTKANSVQMTTGPTTTPAVNHSVPSAKQDSPMEAAGTMAKPADAPTKGDAPAKQATTGATVGEREHDDRKTAPSNAPPTESPAPGDIALSVEAPIASADSYAKQMPGGDAKPDRVTGARRSPGPRPVSSSATEGGDASRVRPAPSADRGVANRQQRLCTESLAVLALCDTPPQATGG